MSTPTDPQPSTPPAPQRGHLCRPLEGRMLGGVAMGVARYLGIDVTLVRIALAVLTVMGGSAIPVYLVAWLLVPEEGTEQSIAAEFIQSHQAPSS